MRNIINVSMPKQMVSFVEKEAKRRKFASVSEFVRNLIRDYEEEKILLELQESEQEIRDGKGKILKSLADLD